MKTKITFPGIFAFVLVSSFFVLPSARGQGSLTPPGPPAPGMVTLSQIQSRTPIASAPFIITRPGSYYLTTNLTVSAGDAIDINTNGVSLDLNGFTIASSNPGETGTAISLGSTPNSGVSDITILNGHIRGGVTNNGSGVYGGPGFEFGIDYPNFQPENVRVSGVSVSGCGATAIFLSVGYPTLVDRCTVQTVRSFGIYALNVKDSAANDCGGTAIYGDQVSGCVGQTSDGDDGIYAVVAEHCQGLSTSGYGVEAGSIAVDCDGSSLSGRGISATIAQNCVGTSTSGYGVYASENAIGCRGASTTGTGIFAANAAFCDGNRPGGTAIQATVANGCYASAGTNIIANKYNMP